MRLKTRLQVRQTVSTLGLLLAGTLFSGLAYAEETNQQLVQSLPRVSAGASVPTSNPTVADPAPSKPPSNSEASVGAEPQPARPPAASPPPKDWVFAGSLRVRVEDQNFWPTNRANGAYSFVGGTLRYG